MRNRILLIEDHPLVREIISEMLRAEGYDVLAVADGRTGLEIIGSCTPGLILCDYHMPEVNGLEVLSGVRATPHTADIPFILMSLDESGYLRKRSLVAGVDAFVAKGSDDVRLLETIRKVIERKANRKEQSHQPA